MFGLTITTKKKALEITRAAYNQGVAESWAQTVDILKLKDRIYLETVYLEGVGHTVKECAFFGKPGLVIDKGSLAVNVGAERAGLVWELKVRECEMNRDAKDRTP